MLITLAACAGDDTAVLVELDAGGPDHANAIAAELESYGFEVDTDYPPVTLSNSVVVRGFIADDSIAALEQHPSVRAVWRDAPIEPYE